MARTPKHSSNPQETPQPGHPGVTVRAILIGIILIPPNTYFYHGKTSALPEYTADNDVANLQRSGNAGGADLPKFSGQTAGCRASRSEQGELLTIYVILSISSAIAGHDMMQTLVPVIPNGFWFATLENEWQQLFWRYLPNWMTLSDLSVLQDFYDGKALFLLDAVSGGLVGTGFMVDDLSVRADMGDDMHRPIASEAVDRKGTAHLSDRPVCR